MMSILYSIPKVEEALKCSHNTNGETLTMQAAARDGTLFTSRQISESISIRTAKGPQTASQPAGFVLTNEVC